MVDATAPPAKKRRLNFTELVEVLIGKEEQSFMLHKDVLCKSSAFFRAALNSDFKESHERKVRLPDVEPCTFQAYAEYAYDTTIMTDDLASKQKEALLPSSKLSLAQCKLYILADRLDDVFLRNGVMKQIIAGLPNTIVTLQMQCVRLVYKHLPETSILRRLLVDVWKIRMGPVALRSLWEGLPTEFMADLAIAHAAQAQHHGLQKRRGTVSFDDYREPEDKCNDTEA